MKNGMNKKKIVVPSGVRYISDWDGYNLEDYNYPHILNKVLTGCGFTEYCIRNNQNIILLSPRRFLLENKEDQHPEDLYYAKNEFSISVNYESNIEEYKKDKKSKAKKLTEEEIKASVLKMKDGIKEYCRSRVLKPKKILVTYDSFRHVRDALTEIGLFDYFQVVVDEFQSIFIDSRFKSSTELELLQNIQGINRLCYVSATPMLDKYLDMLDEFKNLPYLELDWTTEDPSRIIKPELEIRFTGKTLNEEAKRVIESYQKGKFESKVCQEGIIESHEATLFMNSVKGICQTIRSCKLHIEDCNILCAKTDDNDFEVRKAFNDVLKKEAKDKGLEKYPKVPKDYEVIGRIPKKGEPHKMFTLCTRTVYLGADFYSTNSRTFIFSDSNIECLSVDISMDLEQILGRQRLNENPWKNSARLYIRTTRENNKLTEEDYNNFLKEKIDQSNNLLELYNGADQIRKDAFIKNLDIVAKHNYYKADYVAVNHHSGSKPIPVFNNLVLVSEMRAFEIQQIDYKDRFSVFNSLKRKGLIDEKYDVTKEVNEFNEIGYSTEKLKYLVKFTTETSGITEQHINNFLAQIPTKYGDYYRLLGPDRIRANSFQESKIKAEWIKIHSEVKIDDGMIEKIYSTFRVGEKYGKAKIKSTLKDIYSEFSYDKTAKASDLQDYFVLKATTVSEDSKWVNGFEILGKK